MRIAPEVDATDKKNITLKKKKKIIFPKKFTSWLFFFDFEKSYVKIIPGAAKSVKLGNLSP